MNDEAWVNDDCRDDHLKGGLYYRAFDLIKFIEKCRAEGYNVQGIHFEKDSSNIEFLYKEE